LRWPDKTGLEGPVQNWACGASAKLGLRWPDNTGLVGPVQNWAWGRQS